MRLRVSLLLRLRVSLLLIVLFCFVAFVAFGQGYRGGGYNGDGYVPEGGYSPPHTEGEGLPAYTDSTTYSDLNWDAGTWPPFSSWGNGSDPSAVYGDWGLSSAVLVSTSSVLNMVFASEAELDAFLSSVHHLTIGPPGSEVTIYVRGVATKTSATQANAPLTANEAEVETAITPNPDTLVLFWR